MESSFSTSCEIGLEVRLKVPLTAPCPISWYLGHIGIFAYCWQRQVRTAAFAVICLDIKEGTLLS